MTDLSKLSQAQLIALVQKMAAEQPKSFFKTKVSEKGCLSVFASGLRKYGATFYKAEWYAILDNADAIRKAVDALPDRTVTE